MHHLADHVLQFAKEGIEALGDGAQLVGALAAQAAGEVAFALGDVVEHADQLAQRPGDAVADQPDHQQAEGRYHQAGQAHAEDILLALVAQLALGCCSSPNTAAWGICSMRVQRTPLSAMVKGRNSSMWPCSASMS